MNSDPMPYFEVRFYSDDDVLEATVDMDDFQAWLHPNRRDPRFWVLSFNLSGAQLEQIRALKSIQHRIEPPPGPSLGAATGERHSCPHCGGALPGFLRIVHEERVPFVVDDESAVPEAPAGGTGDNPVPDAEPVPKLCAGYNPEASGESSSGDPRNALDGQPQGDGRTGGATPPTGATLAGGGASVPGDAVEIARLVMDEHRGVDPDGKSKRHLVDSHKELTDKFAAALTTYAAAQVDAARREMYRELRGCAYYDALMEGPKFRGWNRSALDRLLREAERALADTGKGESDK